MLSWGKRGNTYNHPCAAGNARQHNGDIYTFSGLAEEQHLETRHALLQLQKSAWTQEDDKKAMEILSTLNFEEIDSRREAIPEAARKTFNWMLEPRSEFVDWLSEETLQDNNKASNIFWISGKAASWKSTLMKFLCLHPRMANALKAWGRSSSGRRVFCAHHFFWHSGTTRQKSQVGMLRSLLYQILSEDTTLLQIASPQRWSGSLRGQSWSRTELWETFQRLGAVDGTNLCLFIDGLDEYSPQDQHMQLAHDILELAKSSNIKLCVSSRPWDSFKTAFKSVTHTLALENLNKQDLEIYALEQLSNTCSAAGKPQYRAAVNDIRRLVTRIVDKSQGVFLWVRLVVGSLCARAAIQFDFDDLISRLDEFPAELETYLKTMIYDRIDATWKSASMVMTSRGEPCGSRRGIEVDIYGRVIPRDAWRSGSETAKALFLALNLQDASEDHDGDADWSLVNTIPTYWTAIDTPHPYDVQSVVNQQCQHSPQSQLEAMWLQTEQKLMACCRDLLIISQSTRPALHRQVEFAHRTVFDFLRTDEMQQLLKDTKYTPAYFQEPDFLVRVVTARCKFLDVSESMGLFGCRLVCQGLALSAQHHGLQVNTLAREMEKAVLHCESLNDSLEYQEAFQTESAERWVYAQRLAWAFAAFGLQNYLQRMLTKHLHILVNLQMGICEKWPEVIPAQNRFLLERSLVLNPDVLSLLCYSGLDVRCLCKSWIGVVDALNNETLHFSSAENEQEFWMASKTMIRFGATLGEEFHKAVWKQLKSTVPHAQVSEFNKLYNLYSNPNPHQVREMHRKRMAIRKRLWPEQRDTSSGMVLYPVWQDFRNREAWTRCLDDTSVPHTLPFATHTIDHDGQTPSHQDLEIWNPFGERWVWHQVRMRDSLPPPDV